jgi:hypothetical protein
MFSGVFFIPAVSLRSPKTLYFPARIYPISSQSSQPPPPLTPASPDLDGPDARAVFARVASAHLASPSGRGRGLRLFLLHPAPVPGPIGARWGVCLNKSNLSSLPRLLSPGECGW